MEQLMNSLLTWSNGKLVPLSTLPSVMETLALQQHQEELPSPRLSLHASIVQEGASLSAAEAPRRIIHPVPQRNKPVHHFRSAKSAAYGNRDVDVDAEEEKKLSRINAEKNSCQELAQAPVEDTSSPGLHSYKHCAREDTASYRVRNSSTISSVEDQGTAATAEFISTARMDPLPPPHVDGLDMMSMDDFEQAHPYVPPPAKMVNITTSPSDGVHADIFNTKCQAKGLTPFFTYVEPSQGSFLATAHVDNQPLEQAGPYASKRAAKEAACKASVSKLEDFPDKADLKRAELQKSQPVVRALPHNDGEHVSKMNTLCQQKRLVPVITYKEPKKGCFSAALQIDDELVGEVGLFANKKDAKEELCKVTYPNLLQMGGRLKRKSMDLKEELPGAPETLKEENWVGTLVEHCQHSKIAYPVYNETGPHPSHGPFSCAVHFAGSPPNGFGCTSGPFKKKADAKKNAAMEAVLWLRHQGQLAVGATSKRRKSSASGGAEATLPAHTTGLTPDFSDAMDITGGDIVQSAPVGKRVQDLCLRLGFTNPAFELTPLSGSFYNVHATFTPQDIRYEPKLAGAVAPVYNVFGKKTAKDECWAELWKVLEEIRVSRGG